MSGVKFLSHDEEYYRAKRNLLFVCALTIVIGVSHADTLALPGFAETANLPSALAMFFLMITACFFGWEYHDQYKASAIKFSEFRAERPGADFDAVFHSHAERIRLFDHSIEQTYLQSLQDRSAIISWTEEIAPKIARTFSEWKKALEERSSNLLDITIPNFKPQSDVLFALKRVEGQLVGGTLTDAALKELKRIEVEDGRAIAESEKRIIEQLTEKIRWSDKQFFETQQNFSRDIGDRLTELTMLSEKTPGDNFVEEIRKSFQEQTDASNALAQSLRHLRSDLQKDQRNGFHFRDKWAAISIFLIAALIATYRIIEGLAEWSINRRIAELTGALIHGAAKVIFSM